MIGFSSATARGRVERLALDEIGILDFVVTPVGSFVLMPRRRLLSRCSRRSVRRRLPVAEIAITAAATSASSSTTATRLAVTPGLLLTTITFTIAWQRFDPVSAGLSAALFTVDPAGALEIVVRPRQFLGSWFQPAIDAILARP